MSWINGGCQPDSRAFLTDLHGHPHGPAERDNTADPGEDPADTDGGATGENTAR
ncbi:hypothetical protein [Saccharomonospora iraqiensis]|uniref:hypothetical protein n=1 Tax=Saccharomonospora iraqiensis TaxID=52698 RepID=UPI0002D35B16|nr:hypothetical protein [Saccharomonospora iraqiensis]